MKTVSIRFSDMKDTTVYLGFVGENLHRRILIDCKKEFEEMPGAVASMVIVPPKGDSYPAVVTVEGNTVMYDVTNSDLIYDGNGELQLTLTKSSEIGKSARCRTKIERSLDPTGTVPTPIQNWIEQANEILGGIPDDIAEALAAAKASGEFDGVGIASIQKTGTAGLVDTYTITLTNNQSYDFTVTNGRDGADPTTLIDDESSASNKVWSANKSSLLEEALDDTQDQIAPNYDNLTFPVAKDALCFYEDGLYKAKQAINTAEEWTAAHWEATTVEAEEKEIKNALVFISPEQFGAKGDGITDDSAALQAALNAGHDVHLKDNKTYYIASNVSLHSDVKITGGRNSVIKTKTPQGGVFPNVLSISGTLKKTTTLTTDYKHNGTGDNAGNKFTLSDMTDIDVGDIMVIVAEDQYYNLSRQYYYLGATMLVTDVYDGHIYTSENMPFNIDNTANVSVKIYTAPQVIIDGVHFEADLDSQGNYKYLLSLTRCKNSIVKNCSFGNMDNGISIHNCFNTMLSNIRLYKSKYDNSFVHDSYGIAVYSSTNTIIERIMTTCAQHAVTITGNEPSINVYIRNCDLTAECRTPGLDTHESVYNLVIEDCVLGVCALNGTSKMHRCRIINNRRVSNNQMYVTIYGSHKAEYSQIEIRDCIFDGTGIAIEAYAQNPIQPFDQVFGKIVIENCEGGTINYLPTVDASILSNTIEIMEVKNCKNFYEIYTNGIAKINSLTIINSNFTKSFFINNHAASFMVDGIEFLSIVGADNVIKKMLINRDTHGDRLILPENVKINVSSSDENAKYFVCGKNLVSNDINDYVLGQVTGNAGSVLSRTKATGSGAATISMNENGGIVYEQKNNTSSFFVYPAYMFYVPDHSFVGVTAKLKNTGETSPSKFKAYIAIVDCKTGKVFNRDGGSTVTATDDGASISFSMQATDGDKIAMAYFYNYTPVANSVTTIDDIKVKVSPYLTPEDYTTETFKCNRLTGDGNLLSFAGVNNIMSDSLNFHVQIKSDMTSNPII